MEITKGSDLILILQLEDIKGRKMRVSETANFKLYVWTANRNNYLVFNKRDINTCGTEDKIAIPDTYMACLESGVICYTYDYSKFDAHFKHTDCMYNKVKEVITDLYWRNSNLNEVPANPVNYQTLEYLKDEIEKVRLENEREIGKINHYITEEYTNKLNEEITRSNQVDVEIFNIIKYNKLDSDTKDSEIENKLDSEIRRSNEVDVEMFNLIKSNKDDTADKIDNLTDNFNTALNNEISRATTKENEIATNLQTEVNRVNSEITNLNNTIENESNRAKTAEKQTKVLLDAEIDRAVEKENTLNDKINEEISRAKKVENELLQHLGDEIERSLEKDREYKQEIDIEVNRAKAEENRIDTILTNEINRSTTKDNELTSSFQSEVERAKTVEKDITEALQNLKTSVSSKNTELSDALNTEISRAKDREDALKADIDTVNSAVYTNTTSINTINQKLEVINGDGIGSIKHGVEDSKHYTDDEIFKLKASVESGINNILKDYATKQDVDNRIQDVIGTAPEALDTLGEIADVLSKDSDAISAINGVLSGKADKADTYTKADVDGKVSTLNSAIATESSRAKAVENKIATDLTTEIQRAKEAESALSNKIDIINGDENTIGSITHAVEDAKHYTDDEIRKLNEINLTPYETIEGAAEKYQEKGNYVEYTDTSNESNPDRKSIVLDNHNNLLGKATDGGAYNIGMVSKWNVVDMGTTSLPINLNGSKARPTYNDDKEIALVEDLKDGAIKDVINETVETSLKDYYTKAEIDEIIKTLISVKDDIIIVK